jgi:hypothetical protein
MKADVRMPRDKRHHGLKHLLYSLLALASSWLLACAWHAVSSWRFWHGIPIWDHIQFTIRDLIPWMIWTGIFCGIGWFVVGLPMALRGHRVLQNLFVMSS